MRFGARGRSAGLGWDSDDRVVLQVSLLEAGKEGNIMEPRLFDEGKQITYSMRKKEGLADYRYFPEPDLPPLLVSDEYISSVEVSIPVADSCSIRIFVSQDLRYLLYWAFVSDNHTMLD